MRFVALLTAALLLALPARAEIAIEVVQTPAGHTAWLVENHDIPFVALELRFQGGASLEPADKRGATNLMVALLEEGSGDLDAQEFATRLEELAARFSYDVGDDFISVSAQMLTENREAAVALLRQSINAPLFDAASIERVRAQVLSGIRSDLKDPDTIVSRTFDTMAFGAHPYATALDGTEQSVTALTRDDLVTAHQGAMARDRVYISAAGDITAAELSTLIDDLLAGLPATGLPMPETAPWLLKGGTTLVEFETPQSVALFGHEGIERDDPDFFAAFVMNQILGAGGFESRLMTEVREKRGLTYGVYSFLAPKDHAAMVVGRVASANDRVAEAISVIKDEWARMATSGVTAEELSAAQTYLTGAYPLRFDGNGPIARILVGMQMDDLAPDYVVTRNSKVEAVTLDDIKRVAARVLRPDDLHFVVVGKPEGLAPDVTQ